MKSKLIKTLFFILSVITFNLFLLSNVYGQVILTDSIINGNNFEKIALSIWFKKDLKTIKGIIVMVPGINGNGREWVYDTAWQNLAKRYDFALLGCHFENKENYVEHYAKVDKGSGQTFLDMLQAFSVQSKHPELATAPLALFGFSAGGQFNYEFTCWKPERVLAFIVNKGGVYYTALAPPPAWEVPGIFILGKKDSPFRNNIITGIFSLNRRFGAKWALAEERKAGHEVEDSMDYAKSFFDKIIPLRLTVDSQTGNSSIQKLTKPGYLGINSTRKIFADTGKEQTEINSWFATRPMAEAWLNFTK